jgi:F-type H+-transporting ATPase subunit epsilon
MTALKEGFVTIHDGDRLHRFELQGGFADVTPAGFTILAEHAREVD